jgi:hypothetical protein
MSGEEWLAVETDYSCPKGGQYHYALEMMILLAVGGTRKEFPTSCDRSDRSADGVLLCMGDVEGLMDENLSVCPRNEEKPGVPGEP